MEAHTREFSRLLKLEFDVLVDRGNEVAQRYGLVHELPEELQKVYLKLGVDLTKFNGDESWTLPMPARYVIDRTGIIRFANVNADYTERPEPEETINQLNQLK